MRKRNSTKGLALVFVGGVLLLPAMPLAAQTATQAKFCQHASYGGQCFVVSKGGGNTDLSKKAFPGGGNWNDSISSVKVGSDVRVKAYEHSNWTGGCIGFLGSSVGGNSNGEYKYLSSYNKASGGTWNDAISSFQVGGSEVKCP